MSSETIMVVANWDGEAHRVVVRIAPQPTASPVFPHYDMRDQYTILQRLGAQVDPPAVPRVLWCEDDPTLMGAPFFVMEHVDGHVPTDVMPYNFGSWLTEAAPADRQQLQHRTIEQLARVHAATTADFAFLDRSRTGETALEAHVRRSADYYAWVKASGSGAPLIERGFEWLRRHWPVGASLAGQASESVLSWGDARIGNIVYRDLIPVALLDWEMAALGPPELDLGWLIFFHRFFEDIARSAGLPGLPDLLRPEDVSETYADLTGRRPVDLDFYIVYAALRQAIIALRVQLRAINFGQAERPEDPDEMIIHREAFAEMIDSVH
jgi:aminoglycoside phosphotransferase (APT) family kinase protein